MIQELFIEKMIQGGDGLARLKDGRVCFVREALPQEHCLVEITKSKKDFAFGKICKILESSPDRVIPKCPLYHKCGGCNLQHLKSEKQTFYLEQIERDNFKRIAHQDLPPDFSIQSGNPWNYRNRAKVVFLKEKKNPPFFGFHSLESNQIIPFDYCPILTPKLNNFLKSFNPSNFFKQPEKSPKKLEIQLFDNNKKISFFYKGMSKSEITKYSDFSVNVLNRNIFSSASVFFQSNLSMLPFLVESVKHCIQEGILSKKSNNEWLIDLYSGVGFFASFLQDEFQKITTVEKDDLCLKFAKHNLKNQTENISSNAEIWLQKNVVDKPATLIVDPPRLGLSPLAIESIIKSSVKQLIYVSCNPVTLARDFLQFTKGGFRIKKAEGFAFYPQTSHLEMLFVLIR